MFVVSLAVITSNHNTHVTHSKVENEDVGGVPHGLVEDDDQDHQEVADEADDDDEGEDDGHDDGDDRDEDLEVRHPGVHLLGDVKGGVVGHIQGQVLELFQAVIKKVP